MVSITKKSFHGMRSFLVVVIFMIAGCGEVKPLQFDNVQQNYVGTWYYEKISQTDTVIDIKRMYLKVEQDGSAEYSKCYVRNERKDEKGSYGGSRRSSSNRDVVVTEVTDNSISFGFNLWVFKFGTDLEVSKPPHLIDGKWYLTIEDAQLSKNEFYDVSVWNCPEIEDLWDE